MSQAYLPVGLSQPSTLDAHAAFNLTCLRYGFLTIIAVCAVFQWVFFLDTPFNSYCTLLAAGVSIVTSRILFSTESFRLAPVPSLMVLFFNVSGLSGPLLLKTLECDALVNNLLLPSTTFAVLSVAQISMLAALIIYQRFPVFGSLRGLLAESLWRPLGLFHWPSDSVFWTMGALGILATFIAGTDAGGVDAGMFIRFVEGLQYFRYAPFLALFRGMGNESAIVKRSTMLALLFYFGLLVVVGLIKNSRGTFVDAGMMCACATILCLGRGSMDLKRLKPVHFLILILFGALTYLLLSRLALSMVAVREFRDKVDYMQLISLSIEAFFDPRLASFYQNTEITAILPGNYSETYISSRLLSRLLMIKFHDNMLFYLSLLDASAIQSVVQYSGVAFVGILPQPMIDVLGLEIDKAALRQSFGDYVIYLADGWGLGGYKTGSAVANLYALSALAFPFLMLLGSLVLFVIYDAFRCRRTGFSPFFGLIVWGCVGTLGAYGFNAESIVNVISGVLRGIPQQVIIYLLAVHGLNILFNRHTQA